MKHLQLAVYVAVGFITSAFVVGAAIGALFAGFELVARMVHC